MNEDTKARKRRLVLAIGLAHELIEKLSETPRTNRLDLLLLSMLRVIRSGMAVLELEDKQYLEEMAAITRTMAEVAINGCYLQVADAQEVDSFRVFDIQKTVRFSRNLEEFLAQTVGFQIRNEATCSQLLTRLRRVVAGKTRSPLGVN